MIKREKKIIILITIAIFIFSLAISFTLRIPPEVDARAYDRIAVNLINGSGYIEDAGKNLADDFSIARVGPGYEFFLAGIYKIFGHRYWVVWFFQALLHALTAFLVYEISKRIFKSQWRSTAGYLAALLVGFSPDLLLASSMLLTETLGIFLMVSAVYLFFRYFDDNRLIILVASAIFFGVAVLTRSQLVVFLPIFAAPLLFKKEWMRVTIFILLLAAIFAPWVARNYKVYNEFIPFNASLGYNLWGGNHIGASGEMETNYAPLIEYAVNHMPIEVNEEGVSKFKEFLIDHPVDFIKLIGKKISIFFSFSRPTGFWPTLYPFQQAAIAFFSLIYSVLIFGLGISGGVLMVKKLKTMDQSEKIKTIFALAMAVLIPLSVIVILVESRYRYPIYPFMAIFAGYLASHKNEVFKNLKYPLMVFAILFLNSFFDFFANFERFWDKFKEIL